MIFAAYLLLGLAAGLVAGAFGIGGGVIIVPALIIIFKQPMPVAVGTSLMVIIAISISGTIGHLAFKNINISTAIFIAIGGIFGAIIGSYIIKHISVEHIIYAKRLFAILIIYAAVRLWMS